MKYIIISPAKNEARFIAKTILSVVNQTLKPIRYIIVDDGSDDDTSQIVRKFQEVHQYISLLEIKSHGIERSGGAKVVDVFNIGFKSVGETEYDFIVKLDSDLELPNCYFEKIANEFQKDSKLGMCGGIIMNKIGDEFIKEQSSDFHIRGAFKSIRYPCFKEIGGFKSIWNWDSVDEMEAMRMGWRTKVIDLPVKHFRPTSQAYNFKKHCIRSGRDAYQMRNDLFLLLKRAISRGMIKPFVFGFFFYIYGYFLGLINKDKRIVNKELSQFINDFNRKRLFKIKRS